jgi:ATP-dependent Clp protease adaptor protein ClpS
MAVFDDSTDTLEKIKTDYIYIEPDKFKVIFINDDFTTMDWVMAALVQIFDKSPEDAEKIMMDVHKKGSGIAGIYVEDVALSKANMTMDFAKQNGFTHFKVTVEKE